MSGNGIDIEALKSAVPLRGLVERYGVTLKRSGRNWKGPCPFHTEKTGSFTVYEEGAQNNHFHCFGCKAHGDAIEFLRLTERLSFTEARERLMQLAGIAPPKKSPPRRAPEPRPRQAAPEGGETWDPIVPTPVDAPKPDLAGCIWYEYVGADGRLLFYQRRFERPDGSKRFAQLTFGALDGKRGWHDRGPAQPFPLYRLDRLATADPNSTALVVEGEKACQAAERLFPDFVVTTWLNGANSVHLTDWSPLRRFKRVIWWADADRPKEKPHGCFIATPAFLKLFPAATLLDTAGLEDIEDGYDAADLEDSKPDDPDAWLAARLHDPYAGLAEELATSTWLARNVPPVDRLLGDLVTTTSRAFLIGPSGLGKTMLGLGFAMGMGFGTGFLHWRASRPARVLYIDGEMPAELLIQRLRDAARRVGREDCIDNIMVFSTEDAEAIAERWPMLGMCEPLNTEAGIDFIKRLVAATKPDAIILDNVQALVAGVQKEEETWVPVLPLVQWLTKQRVGQLWIDHTNKTGAHYGTSTKSWRFDAAGLMTALDEEERDPHEVAFLLSFEKARRRTPDNWDEFAPHIIRLREDVWTSEPAEKRNVGGNGVGKVPPSRQVFYDALVAAIGRHGNGTAGVPLEQWEAETQRRGLIEPPPKAETPAQCRIRLRDFRRAKSELIAAKWVAVDGDLAIDLKRRWA